MNKPLAVADALNGRHIPTAASQATSIEQSRAIAEVQAMVVVAQRMPRDVPRALQQIKESCGLLTLAERAFYKFPRGGTSVTGPSIQLATELARCWGNISYGVAELARNDDKGESEMLAFAWDVQTNVRPSTTFIVPHKRDKRGGPEVLTEMRDIYENNANNAARRLREMIFRAVPSWLVADAQDWCRDTLENGESNIPLPKRIATMLEMFATLGISRERIEARLGLKADVLMPIDLANLKVTYGSLKRAEIDADEEFPTVKAAVLTEQLKAPAKPEPSTERKDEPAPAEKIIAEGDAAEAKTAEREKASDSELDLNVYLAGVIEDADLCDTIAALDALDSDVRKNVKQKTKQMQAWNAHKAKRETEILNIPRRQSAPHNASKS